MPSCSDGGINEKGNFIPKPTIRTTPPVKPPVTSVDIERPKVPGVKKEGSPTSAPKVVETDLVKRFLGALI
ncbi:MAG: hypothetical protein QNL80_09810, partial [Akkermansiaceae bacterium]